MGLIVGITGSYKSGKTTCCKMFNSLGAVTIDADKIYHQLLKTSTILRKKIISAFGKQVLNSNQEIDRKKLAKVVFADKRALKKLTQITHPVIIRELKDKTAEYKKTNEGRVLIIDAPLLIEAGSIKLVDKLVVVKANKCEQIKRARGKAKISKAEIIGRINAQLAQKAKIKLADYVIDNNGSLKQTRAQVKNIWQQIS
ncbi:MAG: dephospho-CoA kinase [Candidatus Omnitrophica bacterium]|nr:dephospho-CoA kinase [Candidatus Omnitrophota bacterium]